MATLHSYQEKLSYTCKLIGNSKAHAKAVTQAVTSIIDPRGLSVGGLSNKIPCRVHGWRTSPPRLATIGVNRLHPAYHRAREWRHVQPLAPRATADGALLARPAHEATPPCSRLLVEEIARNAIGKSALEETGDERLALSGRDNM